MPSGNVDPDHHRRQHDRRLQRLRRPDHPDHARRHWSTRSPTASTSRGAQDSTSFVNSTLSISFSADGTTFYASDDQGIWQFKTTADLADSTSGTLIGLNDLRTLGVPYDGQNSAVAVVDTGVDANAPRSAAGSRRARTSSPAAWATRTWRPAAPAPRPAATGGAGGGGGGAGGTGGGAATSPVQYDRRPRHAGRRRHRPVRARRRPSSRSTSSARSAPAAASSTRRHRRHGGGGGGTGGGGGGGTGGGDRHRRRRDRHQRRWAPRPRLLYNGLNTSSSTRSSTTRSARARSIASSRPSFAFGTP